MTAAFSPPLILRVLRGARLALLTSVLPEHHPLEGLRVAQPGFLAVADRPRLQELIHPLALAHLRAMGLERAALGARACG